MDMLPEDTWVQAQDLYFQRYEASITIQSCARRYLVRRNIRVLRVLVDHGFAPWPILLVLERIGTDRRMELDE